MKCVFFDFIHHQPKLLQRNSISKYMSWLITNNKHFMNRKFKQ
jgi:hypothetical protein